MLSVDAKDGRIIQMRTINADGPRVSLLLGEREAAIVVEGRMQGLIESKKD